MRKLIYLFLLSSILLTSCRERQKVGAFQGTWYKKGYDTEAFIVRGDSMFFPGLDQGYFYNFKKDTLVIDFTEKEVKSQVLLFSSKRMDVWDMSLTKDTVKLVRKPGNMLDTLMN